MHYGNGREAHNGDKVVLIPKYGGTPVIGILYDAVAGNDFCNGRLAPTSGSDSCPNLSECFHLNDVHFAIKPVLGAEAEAEAEAAPTDSATPNAAFGDCNARACTVTGQNLDHDPLADARQAYTRCVVAGMSDSVAGALVQHLVQVGRL